MSNVMIGKIFTFDSAHQLIGHKGKCANLHGHTYRLEVMLKGPVITAEDPSNEGFVIDFGDLKSIVNELIVNRLDHAFLAQGNEPVLATLQATNAKVAVLGFRTTAENLAMYICHTLKQAHLPVHAVRLWETPTAWAEVLAADIPAEGPHYGKTGGCDLA